MRILWLFVMVTLTTGFAQAQQPFSEAQKKAIEVIVRDTLINNPDVLRDAAAALEKKEGEQHVAAQQDALMTHKDVLFTTGKHAVLGNPDGDVTLVQFFDYNCGYCRQADDDLQALMTEDPRLRLVMKEFPVLGPNSIDAALISAQLIGEAKYGEFHKTLLHSPGPATKDKALQTAKKLGFDAVKLEAGIKKPETVAVLEEVYGLANALRINGTPGYVIGTEVFVGAVDKSILKARIKAMRECGKTSC